METMFRDLAHGKTLQPLRSLMRLPGHSGLLGMMPAYAEVPGVIGIKIITVFHGNGAAGYPSHQGVVMLFDGRHGQPLMLFDAEEITAIRTAAASAVATRLLAKEDATHLAVLGTGQQAERHIEAIGLVRKIEKISLWGRNKAHAEALKEKIAPATRALSLSMTRHRPPSPPPTSSAPSPLPPNPSSRANGSAPAPISTSSAPVPPIPGK
jgi:ornithine cyclodeaminase/alanine dehydrogenase-like protein (mu-crystallin family)